MNRPATDDLEVHIVRLEPMRVASVRAVSESPELDAWRKLRAWGETKGLLRDTENHPVFGFNNPNPTEGSNEYGYELWVRADSDTDADSESGVEIKDFEGGLYAVTTCKLLGDPAGSIMDVWRKLGEWAQSSSEFQWRKTHELEKAHDPWASADDMVLDLYLPIEASRGDLNNDQ